jgi:hypothetical protein
MQQTSQQTVNSVAGFWRWCWNEHALQRSKSLALFQKTLTWGADVAVGCIFGGTLRRRFLHEGKGVPPVLWGTLEAPRNVSEVC